MSEGEKQELLEVLDSVKAAKDTVEVSEIKSNQEKETLGSVDPEKQKIGNQLLGEEPIVLRTGGIGLKGRPKHRVFKLENEIHQPIGGYTIDGYDYVILPHQGWGEDDGKFNRNHKTEKWEGFFRLKGKEYPFIFNSEKDLQQAIQSFLSNPYTFLKIFKVKHARP